VAKNGMHLGGYIAPGAGLMRTSLVSGTRQIKLEQEESTWNLLPGTTTTSAVSSAYAAMLMGLIDNGIRQLCLLDHGVEVEMIFTGGDAGRLLTYYPQARLISDLVLDGLTYASDYI
jgi:type III pantothenate kinase